MTSDRDSQLETRITSIQRKLAELPDHPRLGAKLTGDEVAQFEQLHGFELPHCYRAFLTQVGNGGTGPFYGLYRVGYGLDLPANLFDEPPADWFRIPSPLRPGKNQLGGPSSSIEDRERFAVTRLAGLLGVGSQGSTAESAIVVCGPMAGRVVYVDAELSDPYMTRDVDFLGWYERWLDESLAGFRKSYFGFGPAGTESELLCLLMDPEQKVPVDEVIASLYRLPELSSEGIAILRSIAESDAGIRGAAVARLFSDLNIN